MSWTLTTSGIAVLKAGENVDTNIALSGVRLAVLSDQAEGRIEAETRRSWVSNYSGLDTGIKNILDDVCSSLIAKQLISYNMSGYTSRAEAIMMLNVQDDIAREGLKILKDFKSNDLRSP